MEIAPSPEVLTFPDKTTLGAAAARHAAATLRERLAAQPAVRLVAATGQSQFEFLDALTREPGIDWTRVELFHLDEYVGLSIEHPASFRKYLLERLIGKVGIVRYHLLDADTNPQDVAERVGRALTAAPIDLAFVGIGENGHLAFNDPPADFETDRPYLVVTLDDACRSQQVGEGWFASVDDVPRQAISMSVRQILASREIICVAPEERKAHAVRASLEDDISPMIPASILRTHRRTTIYLDELSAALLQPASRERSRRGARRG